MIQVRSQVGMALSADRVNHYRIANQTLASDIEFPELANYSIHPPGLEEPLPEAGVFKPDSEGRLVYRGPGWIGGSWREVACWRTSIGYRMYVPGAGYVTLTHSADPVIYIEPDTNAEMRLVRESVLGPGLILALALHGIWCLHASAALFCERMVAFIGESGDGKSTLAAHLGWGDDPNWRLVCDDTLPVELQAGNLHALPHFPQLKLNLEQQPSQFALARTEIASVFLLKPMSQGAEEITIRSLSDQQAAIALIRHTVASRLFDRQLLASHLEFCSQAVRLVPVLELSFPHDLDLLPRLQQRITENLLSSIPSN